MDEVRIGQTVPSSINSVTINDNSSLEIEFAFYFPDNKINERTVLLTDLQEIRVIYRVLSGEIHHHTAKCLLALGKDTADNDDIDIPKLSAFMDKPLGEFLWSWTGYEAHLGHQPRPIVENEILRKIESLIKKGITPLQAHSFYAGEHELKADFDKSENNDEDDELSVLYV